jgi:hypothetical protein
MEPHRRRQGLTESTMWHPDPAHFDIPTGRSQRMAGLAGGRVQEAVHVWSMGSTSGERHGAASTKTQDIISHHVARSSGAFRLCQIAGWIDRWASTPSSRGGGPRLDQWGQRRVNDMEQIGKDVDPPHGLCGTPIRRILIPTHRPIQRAAGSARRIGNEAVHVLVRSTKTATDLLHYVAR